LIWHVLRSTFTSQKPLFDTCRRAALFPEGIGESFSRRVLDDVRPFILDGLDGGPDREGIDGSIRTDLLSVGELLIDVVRREWPFLSQVVTGEQLAPGIPFRPALLLILAGRIGAPSRDAIVMVGAAIELGHLAAMAQASVEEDDASPTADEADRGRPVNWGNKFALMVGDFLYGQAYAMTAAVASEVVSVIARSLSDSCEGHVLTLRRAFDVTQTPEEYLSALLKKINPSFELPCRLGALLAGATALEVESLSTYGRHLGMAYQLVDEALTASGCPTHLGRAGEPDLRDGVYGIAILEVLHSKTSARMAAALQSLRDDKEGIVQIYALAREDGGVLATLERAEVQAEAARAALRTLPHSPARAALNGLVDYILSRASVIRPDEASRGSPLASRRP
jgi:geranylgeranyl pyrophosphate synthase